MSEVKLNASGLVVPLVSADKIVFGEDVLETSEGKLLLNNEKIEIPDTSNFVTKDNMGYSHFVGEQWISFDGTIPLGGIPFDGRSVERSLYPDLVKWIQDNNRAISKSDYQTRLSNNYSNVPYYVLETNTITMPIYRGYLYFNDNNTAGTYIKQGLPNISGFINEAYGGYGAWGGSGAFSIVNGSNVSTRGGGGGTVNDKDITFNASKSNSIYGASSDVTPHTTCVLIGVYAFNTISNQSNIDLETFRQTMEAGLNSGIIPCFAASTTVPPYRNKLCVMKASKDNAPNNGIILSNYTNANWNGQLFISDNASQGLWIRGTSDGVLSSWKRVMHIEASWKSGTSWYRKYSDGWIEQGGRFTYNQNNSVHATLNFNISFTNTNYQIIGSGYRTDGSPNQGFATFKDFNTSYCTAAFWDDTSSNPGIINWYACGY